VAVIRNLLVLRALGLGDLLTAVPALRGLAEEFPQHRKLLACPAELAPLALHTGAVDEVLPTVAFEPLGPRAADADVAVNLHGRGPESHGVILAASPRRLVAFSSREAGWDGPAFDETEHEVERWCRLLHEHGIAADPQRLTLEPPAVLLSDDLRGVTIVHPGAAAPSRRWPAERFAAVARAERTRGRRVVVTGAAAEGDLACRVARLAGLGPDDVRAGRTGLLELAALVAAAGRVVCGDTGLGHLATALGTPSVVLFGPVPPARWGPPMGRPLHRAVWAGRQGDPHGQEPDRGLLDISVERVLRELDELEGLCAAA
jgi:ADP-heptose:LPS heptosyltransferase